MSKYLILISLGQEHKCLNTLSMCVKNSLNVCLIETHETKEGGGGIKVF